MAVRKETIKQQMTDAVMPVLEPGEELGVVAFTVAGPSPWLAQGIFGLIGLFFMKWYGMAVTDRRVLFIKASMWSSRPKEFAFADPRGSVGIVDAKPGTVWAYLKYRRPDGQVLRLNFHRFWREEITAIQSALGQAGAPPVAPPPPPA